MPPGPSSGREVARPTGDPSPSRGRTMPGDTYGNSWILRTGQRLVTVPQVASAPFHFLSLPSRF